MDKHSISMSQAIPLRITTMFASYPSCSNVFNRLMVQNEIEPEEIEHIVVKGDSFLLTPNRAATEITSYQDTQFVNVYTYTVAAFYGRKPGA